MGVTIAYTGKLSDPAAVSRLTEDMSRLCSDMGWPVRDVQSVVLESALVKPTSTNLRGISVQTHPHCEWLHLHVAPDGRLVNHFYWSMLQDTEHAARIMESLRENERAVSAMIGKCSATSTTRPGRSAGNSVHLHKVDLTPKELDLNAGAEYNWVKTQYGGVNAHVAVCRVLAHVKDRYAPELQVKDDSGYFDHGRLEQLEHALAEVDYLRARVMNAFGKIANQSQTHHGNVGELLEKLEQLLGADRDMLH